MYPWYYIWSPRYRIFHEVLKFSTQDISGVSMRPLCMPQELFTPRVTNKHFFTGIGIKIYCLIKSLKAHANQHIIFSDVDIIVPDKYLAQKLKAYEENDVTAMLDRSDSDDYNIGFMLVKSTPEVIAFFEKVLKRLHTEVKLDQDIFNEEIKTVSFKHGMFDKKDFIQSNMIRKDIWDTGNYSVIQCLYSGESANDVMCGKLLTVVYFYNIIHLLEFVDREVVKDLQDYLYYQNPNHYLCSVNLDTVYGKQEDTSASSANDTSASSAQEFPQNP